MDALKRYLTFSYDRYYPGGGWSDFRGSFDTEEEAVRHLHAENGQFWEVVDVLNPPEEDGAVIRTPWKKNDARLGWRDGVWD